MRNENIPAKFLSPYNPHDTEDRIYALWEHSGFFNPDTCIAKGITAPDAQPYSIVLPPPNVTGTLHLGHAYEGSLQDAFVRYARMRGFKTLWVPGTDHAAIATQSKVEKELVKKEKKNRHDLGREEFLKRVEAFAAESHDTIVNQIRHLGASLDWSREAYTLDPERNIAVRTIFKQMYDAGLIVRGNRIVNWDPKGQTTVSDEEIDHEETKGTLYTFKYGADFPIPIATTRPETKVGDSAVAVHPEDSRYKNYIGQTFEIKDFAGVALTIHIIADEEIDPEYGTGALGVTPAHSPIDWEMADRHSIEHRPQVINEYAQMTDTAGPLVAGLKTKEAREKILAWLRENNLLEKEEEIDMNISKAERSGGTIEPLPKKQWFIDTEKEFIIPHSNIAGIPSGSTTTLKQIMLAVVESGQIRIMPERFKKVYFNWVNNLRPWCISRQIWFGHRIPVWYRDEEIYCGIDAPAGEGWEQDPDTLDTWFSSGLWTFSTLGWPEETPDLNTYHPTTLMAPGYEILFFWVARMILMTSFALGTIPFRDVYLHGIVRNKDGRKFSKSLGNGIDPLDVVEMHGADALRMGLLVNAAPGNDIKFDMNRVKGYKLFANKVWNITRFTLTHASEIHFSQKPDLVDVDAAYLNRLESLTQEVTRHFDTYRLDLAADALYHYIWHTLADEVIEEMKPRLEGEDAAKRTSAQYTLRTLLEGSLKLLHPFMPFITEEIWQELFDGERVLMVEKWPAQS